MEANGGGLEANGGGLQANGGGLEANGGGGLEANGGGLEANGGGLIGGITWLVGCWLELNSPWDLSGSTSTLESVASIRRATFLGGSAGSAGLFSSSSTAIAARLRLLLLLTAVKLGNINAFFQSVSLPIPLGFKARVFKCNGGTL